jgi:hydrogenase assembly chaperone HypC/HupF
MCLMLPAKVIGLADERAQIELHGGAKVWVNAALTDDVKIGQYVLVDRGVIVERIRDDEAATIMAMYAEIGELLGAEDPR